MSLYLLSVFKNNPIHFLSVHFDISLLIDSLEKVNLFLGIVLNI